MHVVLDARTLDDHFPGIGRYTFHLAQALLQRDDLRLTLIVNPRARNTRFPPPEEAFPSATCVFAPCSPLDPRSQWHVPRALSRVRADLYHSPYYVFPYRLSRHLPCVVTLHDTIPTRFPAYFSPAKRWLIRGLKFLAVRRAVHLLADSHVTAQDVARFYRVSPQRITVAHLAPAPSFRPQPRAVVTQVRARYGVPEHYFLYVGSAKPHKNIALLRRVWQRLAQRLGNRAPTLVLVGPIEKMAPVVHWQYLGFVPEADLPALYGGARGFLFPSLYEGFGLPVLEALACGTPVVCSDIPALAEVTGQAAWRLPPHDERAWEDAILTLWEDDAARQKWARQGLARARAFTWEQTAARAVTAYRKALS